MMVKGSSNRDNFFRYSSCLLVTLATGCSNNYDLWDTGEEQVICSEVNSFNPNEIPSEYSLDYLESTIDTLRVIQQSFDDQGITSSDLLERELQLAEERYGTQTILFWKYPEISRVVPPYDPHVTLEQALSRLDSHLPSLIRDLRVGKVGFIDSDDLVGRATHYDFYDVSGKVVAAPFSCNGQIMPLDEVADGDYGVAIRKVPFKVSPIFLESGHPLVDYCKKVEVLAHELAHIASKAGHPSEHGLSSGINWMELGDLRVGEVVTTIGEAYGKECRRLII